ncbi:MAG TPA: 3-deoxy-D-manno-octulosonate 8-phosphate phosphatase [Ignavibacteriales bacterium]|nr:3-deoxy-D-manno-octulosonate 8-phosphate phosphatase [Ignavibacteriales bacterium]
MVIDKKLKENNLHLKEKAEKIKVILTDVDGVLTDTGIYYGPEGEVLKRYSVRDGMGVERLRKYAGIETIIITGENSATVRSRAEKLKMTEFYLGVKKKEDVLEIIKKKNGFVKEEIAYIGDDSNDYEVMQLCGFTATPADGMSFIKDIADYICETKAGYGAFREFAELIMAFKHSS